jgi:hypothetical protein
VTVQRIVGGELRSLQQRVLRSKWWEKNVQGVALGNCIRVSPSSSFSQPCCNYDDTGSMTYGEVSPPLALMHALAHHTVQYTDDMSPHGPEFAKAYLAIVRRFLGQDAKDNLNVAFAQHKVKTRTWSAAAKQEAKQRVALRELKELRRELHS